MRLMEASLFLCINLMREIIATERAARQLQTRDWREFEMGHIGSIHDELHLRIAAQRARVGAGFVRFVHNALGLGAVDTGQLTVQGSTGQLTVQGSTGQFTVQGGSGSGVDAILSVL